MIHDVHIAFTFYLLDPFDIIIKQLHSNSLLVLCYFYLLCFGIITIFFKFRLKLHFFGAKESYRIKN